MTRTAGDIGAGLAPARPARAIRRGERIHVVGVAGAGASAAALHAHWNGAIVSGCDAGGPSPYTPALELAGIPIAWAHDPAHVTSEPTPNRLAVSKALTAIAPDHPELEAARASGLAVEPWQQVVADAAVGKRLVAIAGTHGKSTTAGWLTHVLAEAGRDPSAFVGALLPASLTGELAATARLGKGDVFVVEADEYAGNFDVFQPDVAAITNIDWDHPDLFADRAQVIAAFMAWLQRAPGTTLVVNDTDRGGRTLIEELVAQRWRAPIVPVLLTSMASLSASEWRSANSHFGQSSRPRQSVLGRVRATGVSGTSMDVVGPADGKVIEGIELRTAGRHNVENALVVFATATLIGVDRGTIAAALSSFEGVGRRLERKGEAGGVAVYDDYGHHPTAIRATIEAVRQREPGRRLWVACEPLTFHRTAALLQELAGALAAADGVAVADIWPGRDPDRTIASAAGLAEATRALDPRIAVAAPGDVEATADWLANQVAAGDVVLVMGGGHSYRIGERLLEALRARASASGA